jgi:hypothetical protein
VTHFETMLVEALRDLAKEVHAGTAMLQRLDERSGDHERRLSDLEEHTPAPASSRRKKRLHVAKDVGLTAGSVVALATAALSFFKDPPPPPPPPPPTQAHAPAVTGAP